MKRMMILLLLMMLIGAFDDDFDDAAAADNDIKYTLQAPKTPPYTYIQLKVMRIKRINHLKNL